MVNVHFFRLLFVASVLFQTINAATVTIYEDNSKQKWYFLGDKELEVTAQPPILMDQFKDYGVPHEVAQAYLPRGLSVTNAYSKGHINDGINDTSEEEDGPFDPWSIVWYIGSFGGLIAFFLVISCSEWCCSRHRNNTSNSSNDNSRRRAPINRVNTATQATATPPPAYHLFAPPSYDSISYEEKTDRFDVYVVPVHSVNVEFVERQVEIGNRNSSPPAYSAVDMPPT